jgi:hypothetical protein
MGIRETFQKAAITAVNAFGNVAVSSVYASFASTKALIPATGTISTITPAVQDQIREEGGDVWNVIDKKIDAAGALWELQVRKV